MLFANRRVAALGVIALFLAVPAFGAGRRPPTLSERCLTKSERSHAILFRASDRIALRGVVLGHGTTGVALGHEHGGDLCNWLPFARTLASRGYLVVAFDFRNHGSSAFAPELRIDRDMVAAAGVLRARGAKRIELVGASMGGTAALAAGAAVHAVAVASLSGPSSFGAVDAVAGVRKLSVPVLLLVGSGDSGFVDEAKAVYAAARPERTKLSIQDSTAHGTALLSGGAARTLLLNFLAAR